MRSLPRLAAIVAALWFATPASAQQSPAKLIEDAADAHAAFQRTGGMAAIRAAIAECWQTAATQASFEAAVYCSAFNFTSANFDMQFARLMAEKGVTPGPVLSMADANAHAQRALIVAGVPEDRIPALMDTIRRKAIAATNKRFLASPASR